ncbi:hypothetical protein [Stenotrophomonas sp. PSU_St142]
MKNSGIPNAQVQRIATPAIESGGTAAGMSTPYPNLKPVLVELRLDEVDSRGGAAAEMIAATARPIALSISPELMWYSFVLNDRAITRIAPGTRARGHAGTRARGHTARSHSSTMTVRKRYSAVARWPPSETDRRQEG